jgi:hypothetical protein
MCRVLWSRFFEEALDANISQFPEIYDSKRSLREAVLDEQPLARRAEFVPEEVFVPAAEDQVVDHPSGPRCGVVRLVNQSYLLRARLERRLQMRSMNGIIDGHHILMKF